MRHENNNVQDYDFNNNQQINENYSVGNLFDGYDNSK